MSFNYFVSHGPYSYVYASEAQTFHAECPWNMDDVTWMKETDPNGDGFYQRNPATLCASRHRMRIGIRGTPEEQVPFESSAIVSFRGKDTGGLFNNKYRYDDTTKHSGTVKITWRSEDGETKVIHDDSISGVKGQGDCPNENYKEYLFDRAGNYTIEACVGKSSGDCGKPSGCIEYKLYVPEKEEEESPEGPPILTNDSSTTAGEAGFPTQPTQPSVGFNPIMIGVIGLGAFLLLSKK